MILKSRRLDFRNFLRREVRPDARVVIIGPGRIEKDPSTRFIHGLVKKKGQAIVLDFRKLPWRSGAAYGGLDEFKKSWKAAGLKAGPEPVSGTAARMPFKPKSVDVVYDHWSMPFILQQQLAEGRPAPTTEAQLFTRYLRVLRPGGKAIITDIVPAQVRKLRKALEKSSLKGRLRMRLLPVRERAYGRKKWYEIGKEALKPYYPASWVLVIEKKKE